MLRVATYSGDTLVAFMVPERVGTVSRNDKNAGMGLITTYFVAPDDAAAASTINRASGPADLPQGARVGTRTWWRKKSPAASTSLGYAWRDGAGVEPVVQMATLESDLTGRDVMEIIDATNVLAHVDGGQRLVVALRGELVDALTELPQGAERDVAQRWAHTEEFWGAGDTVALAELISDLRELATSARASQAGLYCWLSV